MTSGKTLAIITAISGVIIATASVLLIVQASETQGALEAINQALEENNLRQALSILFNPQQIIQGGN